MIIHGIGCALVDNIYSPVDFNSKSYNKWLAANGVKDGLITGGLIFGDDLEKTSGTPYTAILNEITAGKIIPEKNVGGPAIVALIHMGQLLESEKHNISFYGSMGDDPDGEFINKKLSNFSINLSGYIKSNGRTPFTDVLSDPSFNNSNGERTFINYIGAAGELGVNDLPDTFFEADMLIIGGTGLTPKIHDELSSLLKKAKEQSCITCVNTVYDFRNQKRNPSRRWPLVQNDNDFKLIDVLIADNEEALRISGKDNKTSAADFFQAAGVKSGIITHGADDILCFSDGSFFSEQGQFMMPVSDEAGREMRETSAADADTTGCGDNFAGGVYTSMVTQLSGNSKSIKPQLRKAAALGAVSGGFAGLYRGGVYYETHTGEKIEKLEPLLKAYENQTGRKYE